MTGKEAAVAVADALDVLGIPYVLSGSFAANHYGILPRVEDVVVTKLRWCEHANRGKDRDDIRDVIAVQDQRIDWPYVYRWCDEHGTRGLLNEIRRDAEAGDTP